MVLDHELVAYWRLSSKASRYFNQHLIGFILQQLAVPKRGIKRLMQHFCQAHPHYQPHFKTLLADAVRIGQSPQYWQALVPLNQMPICCNDWAKEMPQKVEILPGIFMGIKE